MALTSSLIAQIAPPPSVPPTRPPAPVDSSAIPTPPAVPATSGAGAEMVQLQFPNNPIDDILALYETLTGVQLIRDANLAGANISISVPEQVTRQRAIQLIEASLLLNGYAFVPAGENMVKILNTQAGKQPRSEGVTLYANASSLPAGEEVVSYFMQLRYITPDEAFPIFQNHVPLHSYGSIVPVPTAQALLITENSTIIRQLVALRELIDVPPAEVVTEFVQLNRANAERVAESINQLLEARKAGLATTGRPGGGGGGAVPPPPDGSGNVPVAVPSGGTNLTPSGLALSDAQVLADPRTNRIIIMTRPLNLVYLRSLVLRFDEAVDLMDPFERSLRYVAASDVLPVLGALLAETEEDRSRVPTSPQDGGDSRQANTGGGGRGGGLGGGSGSGVGGNIEDRLAAPTGSTAPESINVGSTTLIADRRANSILVLGPPESRQKVATILDRLDTRPLQVYLSTVIGQLTVGRGQEFGVDVLQKFSTNSSTSSGIAGSLRTRSGALDTIVDPTTLIEAAAFPLPAGLTLYGAFDDVLDVYVKALQTSNRFRVLSRPTIYTANNKKAVILSGQKVAVPTSTLSSLNNTGNDNVAVTSNIQYQDVVLKLEVVPLINSEREITLEIAQQNDSVVGEQVIAGNAIPTIGTQQINTTVTVPNRSTIVLGGLVTDSKNRSLSGIPFLQNIPLLGYLFRQTQDRKERSELIVLLQPTVVELPSEIVEESYEEQSMSKVGQSIRRTEFALPPSDPEFDQKSMIEPESPFMNPERGAWNGGSPGR